MEYEYRAGWSELPPWFWPVIGIVALFFLIVRWKVFAKAGRPGWESLIPFYNLYIWTKIIGRPWWWLLLCLIPLVNIYFIIVLMRSYARSFGQGVGFTAGLILLRIIFEPILAFSSEIRYVGPNGAPLDNPDDISSIGNN